MSYGPSRKSIKKLGDIESLPRRMIWTGYNYRYLPAVLYQHAFHDKPIKLGIYAFNVNTLVNERVGIRAISNFPLHSEALREKRVQSASSPLNMLGLSFENRG